MTHPIVVAVDGTAASGKGTLARGLAKRYHLDYLDTGSLYRAVGWTVLRSGGNPKDPKDATTAAESLDFGEIDDALLRFDEISRAAASVAAIQGVRLVLLGLQRQFAKAPPSNRGSVLDGRDIGTVVVPHADVKLFITARIEVRANRRHLELLAKGESLREGDVSRELAERDQRDTDRLISPMRPADDAVLIDTSDLSIAVALATASRIVEEKTGIQPSGEL
jgi:cytidylate kinase